MAATLPRHPTEASRAGAVAARWPLAGALAAVCALAGVAVSGTWAYPTEAMADNALLLEHLEGKALAVWAYQALNVAAALALVVFGAGLRARLARQEPAGSLAPTVAMAGVVLVAALALVGSGLGTEQFHSLRHLDEVDPDLIGAMQHHLDTLAWVWAGAGLTAGAVAHAALRHGSLPRWVGRVSAVFAVLITGFALSPLQYLAAIVGAVWLLVVSIGFAAGGRADG